MYLSELQEKDIISVKDGRRIGKIIDAEISSDGKIMFLILEEKKSFRKMLSNQEVRLSFTSITKIGEDVILVDL